jgi:two-component system CheB/CheR fusion protein
MGPWTFSGRDPVANGSVALTRLRQAAFDADPTAQLVIDAEGILTSATAGARQHFAIGAADIGRPVQELEISYRPVDLRSAIDRATAEQRELVLRSVHHFVSGQTQYFDVTVAPLFDDQHTLLGVRIVFTDSTALHRLQNELNASKQELQAASDQLQSTNEELETTNEELQSTVEKLETTNEELQSTNEELETMNEELQSTNDELQTMNDELRMRSMDADALNAYLESVFGRLRSAVVVLDQDHSIMVWNRRAEDLWGLRRDEVLGTPFLNLDTGLPVADLAEAVSQVMSGKRAVETHVRAVTRGGRPIDCLVTVTNLASPEQHNARVVLVMDEQPTEKPG